MTKIRQWSVLTTLGVLAILVAGWMAVVRPQHARAAALQAQAASIEQHNSVLANQVAALRARSKDLPAQQARLAAISVKIPDNPALPALVRALTAAASGAGVDLVTIAPATPAAVTGASAGSPASRRTAGSASVGSMLEQIPVTLTVHGTYFTIEQFFANLENLQRALRVTQFSLAPGGGAAGATTVSGGPSTVNQLAATISAYVYTAPAATTPAPALGTK